MNVSKDKYQMGVITRTNMIAALYYITRNWYCDIKPNKVNKHNDFKNTYYPDYITRSESKKRKKRKK